MSVSRAGVLVRLEIILATDNPEVCLEYYQKVVKSQFPRGVILNTSVAGYLRGDGKVLPYAPLPDDRMVVVEFPFTTRVVRDGKVREETAPVYFAILPDDRPLLDDFWSTHFAGATVVPDPAFVWMSGAWREIHRWITDREPWTAEAETCAGE